MAIERSAVEWATLPLKKYAQFSGRAPRAEYWWFYLGTIIATVCASIIDGILGFGSEGSFPVGPFYGLLGLGLIIPSIAVTVRRLHDTNRTGWWILLPVVGYGLMIVIAGGALAGAMTGDVEQSSATAFGGMFLIAALVAVISVIVLFVFMVLRGTMGPNDYGPDPYGEHENLETVFS